MRRRLLPAGRAAVPVPHPPRDIIRYTRIPAPGRGPPCWPRAAARPPAAACSVHLGIYGSQLVHMHVPRTTTTTTLTLLAVAAAAAFLVSASQLYHRVTDRKGAYLFSPAAACPHRHRTGEGNAINPPCLFQRDTTSAAACLSGTPPSLFVVPSRRQDAVERALPTCGAGW
jgi:hypothetical protein